MAGIHSFFDLLRTEGGAVWLQQRHIRLFTPRKLQTEETAQFIRDNKDAIITWLQAGNIDSKEAFFDAVSPRSKPQSGKRGDFQLVKPYHSRRNGHKPYLVFIHPGHGSWDLYQPLADMLADDFNCIGIDNYNLYHTEKIYSLQELSSFYLSALTDKNWLKDPVNLLGWSLGGHIALEMAATLEKLGFRHINIFLLDTFLPSPPIKYKRSSMHELEAMEIDEMAAAADTDEERMEATLAAEYLLASIPVSRYLKYSNLILFRATLMHESPLLTEANSRKRRKLPDNHIEEAAASVLVIDLDCDHYNILDTRGELIAEYILSFE